MLEAGSPIFVSFTPGTADRESLLKGKALSSSASTMTAVFETEFNPAIGTEADIYCFENGKFIRVRGKFDALLTATPTTVRFVLLPEREIVDSREMFRVILVGANIAGVLDAKIPCQLVDASPNGLAIVANHVLKKGAVVSVRINYERRTATGSCEVRNARERDDGNWRYGLTSRQHSWDLKKMLHDISNSIKHDHLRQLRGFNRAAKA